MNELIKQFAEESGAGWDNKYHWYVGHEQMKQFAKLIVRETVKEMSHQLYWHGVEQSNNPSFYKAIEKTLEHFGVEE